MALKDVCTDYITQVKQNHRKIERTFEGRCFDPNHENLTSRNRILEDQKEGLRKVLDFFHSVHSSDLLNFSRIAENFIKSRTADIASRVGEIVERGDSNYFPPSEDPQPEGTTSACNNTSNNTKPGVDPGAMRENPTDIPLEARSLKRPRRSYSHLENIDDRFQEGIASFDHQGSESEGAIDTPSLTTRTNPRQEADNESPGLGESATPNKLEPFRKTRSGNVSWKRTQRHPENTVLGLKEAQTKALSRDM